MASKHSSSKAKKISKALAQQAEWQRVLEGAFGKSVTYSCAHCLKEAHDAVVAGKNGYVTDNELIDASGGRLKHK